MARFDGKRVLVLGGSAGIGLAAARAFAAEGARLALTGRDPAALERAAAATGGVAYRCDIGDVAAMRGTMAQAAAQLGGIDVLCVNAGIGGFATLPEVSEAFWDQLHTINLKGCVFALQSALPHLVDGGAVVVTGSIGARLAVGSSRVDLQACKLEYSIVSPK